MSPHQIPGSAAPPLDELDDEEEEEEEEEEDDDEPPDELVDDPPDEPEEEEEEDDDDLPDEPPELEVDEPPLSPDELPVLGSVPNCDDPGSENSSVGAAPLHAMIPQKTSELSKPARFMAHELYPRSPRCPMP